MPQAPSPDPEEREVVSLTPEARRLKKIPLPRGVAAMSWHVVKRTAVGTFNDGFIHAGNLAYMSMLAIFPFFITGAAIFSLFGEEGDRAAAIDAVLIALPPVVGEVIGPAARQVIAAVG